jgi:hypothetical protein
MSSSSCPMGLDEAVNTMASPPGRIWGQRWVASPGRSLVTGCGVPPVSRTRNKGPTKLTHHREEADNAEAEQ